MVGGHPLSSQLEASQGHGQRVVQFVGQGSRHGEGGLKGGPLSSLSPEAGGEPGVEGEDQNSREHRDRLSHIGVDPFP
jgi:hypothetical protein